MDAAKYRLALRQAEAAFKLSSRQAPSFRRVYLNTLGVAQYRLGQYAAALDSLKHADTLFSAQLKEGFYLNLAFLAMTNHQLGEKTEAQAILSRLRKTMKSRQLANNKVAQAQLREAEALLEGKAADPKK